MIINVWLSFQPDPQFPEAGPIMPERYWDADLPESVRGRIPDVAINLDSEQVALLNDNLFSWRYDWATGEFYQPPQLEARYLRVVVGRIVEISPEARAELDAQDFAAAKQAKIREISRQTYGLITAENRMPEWRQTRWMRYCDTYQRLQRGETVESWAQADYDNFPWPTETHELCYTNCNAALQWVTACVAACNAAVLAASVATSQAELEAVQALWPDWPL
jgi:hypothetical protein